MICPECDHEHLGDIPGSECVMCGEDMSEIIEEADRDEAADNRRRDLDLRRERQ